MTDRDRYLASVLFAKMLIFLRDYPLLARDSRANAVTEALEETINQAFKEAAARWEALQPRVHEDEQE